MNLTWPILGLATVQNGSQGEWIFFFSGGFHLRLSKHEYLDWIVFYLDLSSSGEIRVQDECHAKERGKD